MIHCRALIRLVSAVPLLPPCCSCQAGFLPTYWSRQHAGLRANLDGRRKAACSVLTLAALGTFVLYSTGARGVVRAAVTESAMGPARPDTTLTFTEDRYDGVIIDPESLPESDTQFEEVLSASVSAWRQAGKRGLWLKIPSSRSELIPLAVKQGFEFHHAEKAYLMMTRWLPDTEDTLPPNASHQVGVGAYVLNSLGQILVVREKNGPLRGTNVFKIPTGLVGQGEDLAEAAAREVLEETGLAAVFESILSIRHGHNFLFGKSDLFFTVKMRLISDEAEAPVPQESEIEEARWMPLEDFVEQAHFAGTPLYSQLNEVMRVHAQKENKGRVSQFFGYRLDNGWGRETTSMLYHGKIHPGKISNKGVA